MKKSLPKITYNLSRPMSERYRGIEVNGELIHWIDDTDKFYELFGFTPDMRKAGILPEEFIWDEYIDKRKFDFSPCMQIQIIQYLREHSKNFLRKYGHQCEKWLAAHVTNRGAIHDVCETCKMKPSCTG